MLLDQTLNWLEEMVVIYVCVRARVIVFYRVLSLATLIKIKA